MSIAAIICEYNPFHNGHKYQIDTVREILGNDTAIIAIMSGNYTQRGEVALCDKIVRAKAAVLSGVNLVLELPFPYSMSSAEFFAESAVSLIERLGCVDYLAFGSECDSLEALKRYAEECSSESFKNKLIEFSSLDRFSDLGYPKLIEKVYKEIYGQDLSFDPSLPNNILAVEYLKALYAGKSSIKPLSITRKGAGYNDGINKNTIFQSASAIRSLLAEEDHSAYNYIPNSAKETFLSAFREKLLPADAERISSAVISYFRLNPPSESRLFHDTLGGLYNRLHKLSFETNSISSLTSMTETKKYTRARIRRAIFNSFFGVTSSDLRTPPAFTQLLALDNIGRSILKGIPKSADLSIITKPADATGLSETALKQRELSLKADSVYRLCFEANVSGNATLTTSPFVKK